MNSAGFALYELMKAMAAQHPRALLREDFPKRDCDPEGEGVLLAVNLLRVKGYAQPAYADANQKKVGWMLTEAGLALWESARRTTEQG